MSINRGARAALLLFVFGLPLGGAGLISLLPQQEHLFRTMESDGVPVAVTTGGPKYSGELFTYEEVLTIPQERVRKRAILSDPTAFTMDEEGFFYVVDTGNHRLVVFEHQRLDGEHVLVVLEGELDHRIVQLIGHGRNDHVSRRKRCDHFLEKLWEPLVGIDLLEVGIGCKRLAGEGLIEGGVSGKRL